MIRTLFLALMLACTVRAAAQQPAALPCRWYFNRAHHAATAEGLAADGIPAEDNPAATLRYEGAATAAVTKNHLPAVTGGASGDRWVFSIPVDSLAAGERIGVDFLYGTGSRAAHRYRLEYCDKGRWRPAGRLLHDREARGVRYTHRLYGSDSNNSYKVFGTIRLRHPLLRDTLRIRWVQAEPCQPADSAPQLESRFNTAASLGIYVRNLGSVRLSKPLHVLFIGNSYTYYNIMPGILRELAFREGVDLRVEMFTIGGCTMERHLNQSDCRDLIQRGGYDFAILQDMSLHPALLGSSEDYGIAGHMQAMVDYVRRYNPHVKPLIEMTWGRRDGYKEKKYNQEFLTTYAAMHERTCRNTLALAEACGTGCLPVGLAWGRVRAERPDIELYNRDGTHPSYAGSYLIAAVAYVTLTGRPFGASPADGLLDAATAAYLREVATATALADRPQ